MSYGNSFSREGNVTGTQTVTFPWPLREVQLTNDSLTTDLQIKLNDNEEYRTLKPLETLTLRDARMPKVLLKTTAQVEYRLWGLG